MSLLCSLQSIPDAFDYPVCFAGAWAAEPGYRHGNPGALVTLVPEDADHTLELPGGRMLACSAVVLGFMLSPSSALSPHLSERTP